MAIGDARYTPRMESKSKKMNEAAKYSSRRRMRCASTDMEFTPEAKKAFDDNYDAIFGKKKLKHGT